MKLPETVEEYVDQLMTAVKPLRDRTRTDKLLRRALLTDPIAALEKENILVVPGLKIRFYETGAKEIAIQLPPYEGKD